MRVVGRVIFVVGGVRRWPFRRLNCEAERKEVRESWGRVMGWDWRWRMRTSMGEEGRRMSVVDLGEMASRVRSWGMAKGERLAVGWTGRVRRMEGRDGVGGSGEKCRTMEVERMGSSSWSVSGDRGVREAGWGTMGVRTRWDLGFKVRGGGDWWRRWPNVASR